ncbi:cytochrome c biogenesis CcdA family protein [Nocardioides sp.]|uniref:cytochrome c biogenesis CcdA family protein n=1 Tax=Nocardioides sp. TaxID=35761 RepID=UPI002734A0EC|nr:cytochrome c biogenesis CcdA family protein [Nocardioides sp.]MDP3892990.1 cytochrome c biogenesis CcdA family protein [Nocardioides sp.]
MEALALDLPSPDTLSFALGAGMLAAVNPCGFALLPAYLGIFVLDERPGRAAALGRAMRATGAMTLGFAAVFAAFGLAIMPVASSVTGQLPWFTVVLGLVLALAGTWMLLGRSLPKLPRPRRRRPGTRPVTDSMASMAGFGASYAVASLGCTIAPFLAVVVTAFRAGSTLEGGLLFLAYALGMGLVVGAAAVAVALARRGLLDRVRRAGAVLPRVAGSLLLAAGAYVAWYGAWELRVLHRGAGSDPVVEGAARLQQWLASTVSWLGWPAFAGALLVLLALGLGRRRTQWADSAARTASSDG